MRPEQRIRLDRAAGLDRRGGQQGAHKGEGDPDRADDQIFPHRLEREPVWVKRDQEGAEQRRRLHADPHDAEIVRQQDEHHRRQRAQPQRAKPARRRWREAAMIDFAGEIDARESRAKQEDEDQNDDMESGKSVNVEPLLGRRHKASAAKHRGPDVDRERHLRRADRNDSDQHLPRAEQQERQRRTSHRKDQHRDDRLFGKHGGVSPSVR